MVELIKMVIEEEVLHSGVEFEFHGFEDVFVFFELGSQQNNNLVEAVQLGCVASCVLVKLMLVAERDLLDCELFGFEVGL
jgi:hypothetical protein